MEFFHDFTAPMREAFAGNLLLLLCSLFYLVWWIVCFRPGASGSSAGGGVCLALAFLTGIASVFAFSGGIRALAAVSKGVPVRWILLGAAVSYLVLLGVTAVFFRRPVTSELILVHIWAALELSLVAVLYGAGRFGAGRAAVLTALIAAASAAGLVCYVLYYRLGGTASFVDGIVPLASDAAVMAVFLGVMALS